VSNEAIGRVKTTWVTGVGPAVISTLLAKKNRIRKTPKLSFSGSVVFSERTQQHLQEVVLQHVTDILIELKQPKYSFTISGVNLGVTASEGEPINVTGFSLDLSVFMACLSNALSMPIAQDILFTGNMGTSEGDICMVDGFENKCEVAKQDQEISRFVYPSFEQDHSLQELKPTEYNNLVADIRSCRGRLKLVEVSNTLDVFQKAIDPEAILIASLRSDFFELTVPTNKNNLTKLINFFIQDNNQRFFEILENYFFDKDFQSAHELIQLYVNYHIKRKKYPAQFGQDLYMLLTSVPHYVLKLNGIFPLFPMEDYIRVIQYVTKSDHEDLTFLQKAHKGDLKSIAHKLDQHPKTMSTTDKANHSLDFLLEQLDPDVIQSTILGPFDDARGNYRREKNRVASSEEFPETITEFYIFLHRHTNQMIGMIDPSRMSMEAVSLLPKVYKSNDGYKQALSDAITGNDGGLRNIYNRITDYLKEETKQKYIFKIFLDTMDPLDYQSKVDLVKQLIARYKEHLPAEILSSPPERFVEHYEELILAIIKSREDLKRLLIRL
jgi:hypothetical protein